MYKRQGKYEEEHELLRAEQIIRPTGLLDPAIDVRPVEGQIDDLLGEIHKETDKGNKVLVTTLTKRMAEELTDYMREVGIRVKYLHSDIDTLERIEIVRDLRMGVFDVLVGINLLREGLDIPEITLVAILDADKEGFLRSETSLVQTIGRAARNSEGHVIMYADHMTDSMHAAITETERRREIQDEYNKEHGITPQTIKKDIRDLIKISDEHEEETGGYEKDMESMSKKELKEVIERLSKKMNQALLKLASENQGYATRMCYDKNANAIYYVGTGGMFRYDMDKEEVKKMLYGEKHVFSDSKGYLSDVSVLDDQHVAISFIGQDRKAQVSVYIATKRRGIRSG